MALVCIIALLGAVGMASAQPVQVQAPAPAPRYAPGVKLPASLTAFGDKAANEYHKVAGQIRGEAQKIKGEGEQVLQKIDNLPQGQKVGIEVGSAVGVAAVAGAIGGIAEAAHAAHMKKAQERRREQQKKAARAKASIPPPAPTVVMVPVVVPVLVTPEPKHIFAWPRLYEQTATTQAGNSMGQGTLMISAAFVVSACVLLGISFAVYLKKLSQSRVLIQVECQDDDDPLLA